MSVFQGRSVVGGKARGHALVTRMPMNFTASFTKIGNLIPGRRSIVYDRHHDLYKRNVKGSVVVAPACIGSTFTGMVILQLIHDGCPPAAIIMQAVDSLLVSGSVLGRSWFDRGIPIVEYRAEDIFEFVHTGDKVEVDGDQGRITVIR